MDERVGATRVDKGLRGGAPRARVGRHNVRDELERRILSGESKAGDRLNQQNLARELGVAQSTVRESLLDLHWLGLVESVDHLGVFVDTLDVARVCEAYEVREALEGQAARLACSHTARADISALRGMVDRILSLGKEGKDEEAASLDRAFHLKITELSRNNILFRLSETYRVLGMMVRAYRDPLVIHEEHHRIVEAIEHNFAEEAERQARRHIVGARQMIEQQAREGKFRFSWVR